MVVDEVVSKEISDIRINITNLAEGYTATAISEKDSSIVVIVKGSQAVIDSLDTSTIYASVDLSGLQPGDHEVEVKVTGEDNKLTYNSRDKKIKLHIEKR